MKYALALLALCIGFGSGWYLSNQRMEEKVKEALPEETLSMFKKIDALIGTMDKEEVEEILDQINAFSSHAIREMDQMDMWRAATSNQILIIEEEKGFEKAREHAHYLTKISERSTKMVSMWANGRNLPIRSMKAPIDSTATQTIASTPSRSAPLHDTPLTMVRENKKVNAHD